MLNKISKILLVGLLLLTSAACASQKLNTNLSQEGNSFYLPGKNTPILTVSQDFHYGGAEIVPSPNGQSGEPLKRHVFPGPSSSFVTVVVMEGTPNLVRKAVNDRTVHSWEFLVQTINEPEWVRIVGSKTPCCVNLLHTKYIFVPAKGPWDKNSPLPADLEGKRNADEAGHIFIVTYGEPLPGNIPAETWVTGGTLFGNAAFTPDENNESPALDYDSPHEGLVNSKLGPKQRSFLTQHAQKAKNAYSLP